jgi:hypothetical protein
MAWSVKASAKGDAEGRMRNSKEAFCLGLPCEVAQGTGAVRAVPVLPDRGFDEPVAELACTVPKGADGRKAILLPRGGGNFLLIKVNGLVRPPPDIVGIHWSKHSWVFVRSKSIKVHTV